MTPAEALDGVSFFDETLRETLTIRQWLKRLLITLWKEQEGFSGKRPFGNSSWDSDLLAELIRRGIVPGNLDRDGWVEDGDCDDFVRACIEAL